MKTKVVFFFIAVNILTYPQSISKRGGICFRVDDNHTLEKFNQYADKFNKYNKEFCFALNLERKEFNSDDYITGIRQLQADGHELLDHTPEHRTSYFNTKFEPSSYISLSGVDHVNNNKICLEYSNEIKIAKAKRTGYVDIDGNNIISNTNDFDNFRSSERYIYFPDLPSPKLVIKKEIVNSGLLKITDPWQDSINLGKHNYVKYYTFTSSNIHLTIDALNILANETRKLVDSFNLERPITWIQPGVSTHYTFPYVYRNEIKQSFGQNFNYVAAAVYPYRSEKTYKVFNEYDPQEDKRYGIQWGDFNIDTKPLKENLTIIADAIAKHHVLVGHSHFNNLLGGWDAYLGRVDSLLAWCSLNNIPVRTYQVWSDFLYNKIPNPQENVFPVLNIDLDKNGTPDGYKTKEGVWNSNDGVDNSKNYCYSINSKGTIFKVENLGGIEKGENNFQIWTKGENGDSIEVIFKVGKKEYQYKFSATNSEWTLYTLDQSINGNNNLNIPEKTSMIDITIRCSNYSSGTVKVSGIKLNKKGNIKSLVISPNNIEVNSNSGDTTFSIYSNVVWNVNDDADWLQISPVHGNNNDSLTASFSSNPDSLYRTANISISGEGILKTATIVQQRASVYKVNIEQEPNGTSNLFGAGKYIDGMQATITCIPHTGWEFDSWRENNTIITTDSIYSFKVEQSHNFVAKLSQLTNIKKQDNQIPQKYELFQNYPNPFNPTTQIRFALLQKSNVVLEIFDLLGKKIETLLNKNLSSGFHSVIFNASKYPSGIYLYKLKTEKFHQAKKLILLK